MINRGNWLATATALFYSWAILSFCVRMWMNLTRKQQWRLSETTASAAFILAAIHVGVNFWAISDGYGKSVSEIPETSNVHKALYMSQISYILAVGLTKVSTAFLIKNLTRFTLHTRLVDGTSAMCGVWVVASVLAVSLRGDLNQPWATVDGSQLMFIRWIVIETTGLIIEAIIFALSIGIFWGLQIKATKRLQVLAIFGCRLLLVPLVAIRLYFLNPSNNTDPTITSIIPHIFTEAVMNGALIATSLPALKPFLQPLHNGSVLVTAGSRGYQNGKSPVPGSYVMSSRAEKKFTSTNSTSVGTGDIENAPKMQDRGQSEDKIDDSGSVDSNSSRRGIIRATKTWQIRYEER